jgi:hypothetical protein
MNKFSSGIHILSKSTFIRGMQCPKSLYLNKFRPELRDETSMDQQDIFQRGIDVGILARDLFPGGIDCNPGEHGNYIESAGYTKKLIDEGTGVIYEASFIYDDILCLLDILVRENGAWNAYEVKSSTKISDTFIMDASLQYYVINGSGLDLENFYIVYIDNGYFRRGDLDINKLFTERSVGRTIKNNQNDVRASIGRFKAILRDDKMPDIDIGEHCTRPYLCDFKGHCWKHIPAYSVFDIPQIGYKAFSLYKNGIINIADIPESYPLNDAQKLQIKCHKTNQSFIDRESIKSFIDTVSYPLYFMDFEAFMPAVPLYENSKPYQFIPFQYSLHYMEKKNGGLDHSEFLAETGSDPRLEFLERLLVDTLKDGDILVYNKGFETARLAELARDFPQYQGDIKDLILRIIDLMIPFQKKYYYTPEMKGRYSIKYVLPALIRELNYKNMTIGHGRDAMNAYESLQYENDKKKTAETRKALLEYCKMDTLALVKLLGKLEETI